MEWILSFIAVAYAFEAAIYTARANGYTRPKLNKVELAVCSALSLAVSVWALYLLAN